MWAPICVTWDFPPPAVSVTSRLPSHFLHGLQGAATPQTQPEGIRAGKDGLATRVSESQPGSLLGWKCLNKFFSTHRARVRGRQGVDPSSRERAETLKLSCRPLPGGSAETSCTLLPGQAPSPPLLPGLSPGLCFRLPPAACLPWLGPGSKPA